jgi:O-antigen/teichoic acid export membrane protein
VSTAPGTPVRSGIVIAAAMGVMNVSTYGFTILAARMLGPVEYGALAAVMGLLLVLNVVSLGLQATGARRVAAAPSGRDGIEQDVMRTTYRCSLALGGLALVASPLVVAVLNLDSWAIAFLVAVTVVPLTVMGGQAGILQGERRWVPLAAIFLGMGLGRLLFGLVALVVEPDTLGAMIGVAAGAFAPAVVGWWTLRSTGAAGALHVSADGTHRTSVTGLLLETVHNSHALLAFFTLSNADVLIARSVLPEHQAGLYAGGLILTKAVLFLPQFVVVIAFPSMSTAKSGRRLNLMSLGLVLVIGLVTVVGAALLSGLAVTFVGGSEYAELNDLLWAFAALGTVLAMLQLMVYNVLARQRQRAVFVLWAALVVLVLAGALAATVTELLVIVLVVDTATFGVLLVGAGIRSLRQEATAARH